MGAVGSIELMVVMAVAAIATFNLKKEPLAISFFPVIVHCLDFLLPKRTGAQISDSIFWLILFLSYTLNSGFNS